MNQICKSCKKELNISGESSGFAPIAGICSACSKNMVETSHRTALGKFLDTLNAPVLLMQPEPRLVRTANKKALELFGKGLPQIEGHRGGEVFDCVHSFTEAGCGKDVNCEDCKIKNSIVTTFSTGKSFHGVSTFLEIRKKDEVNTYLLEVSTEKIGELALLRIDQYKIKS